MSDRKFSVCFLFTGTSYHSDSHNIVTQKEKIRKNYSPYSRAPAGLATGRCSTIERVKTLKEEQYGISTKLSEAQARVRPDELPAFLEAQKENMVISPRPFTDYVRRKFREKGIAQQDIFLAADLSENYGYKLIAGEKRTVSRDIILRICLAAHFNLDETQESLILYGMAPLHPRLPRDLVLIVAINSRLNDIHEVSKLLVRCGQPPLVRDMP